MKKISITAISLFVTLLAYCQTKAFHDLTLPGLERESSMSLSQFKGKMVLIVNVSSLSDQISQCEELEKLAMQFRDSNLIVIACPSNDFGGEPNRNEAIQKIFSSRFKLSYPITGRVNLTGDAIHPMYLWLTRKEENGVMNIKIQSDFHKILVDGEGRIIGSFSAVVRPLDDVILRTIRNNRE